MGWSATEPVSSDTLAASRDTLAANFAAIEAVLGNAALVAGTALPISFFSFPSGGIILWSGAVVDIPTGWVLCNGSSSTPDLRNKFVIGAGSTYAVAATGGEATHVLTTAEMAAHTHTLTMGTGAAYADGGPRYTAGSTETLTTSSVGSGTAHNTLPPYYALCYIMKT
jgi:microcystin-dependent protein